MKIAFFTISTSRLLLIPIENMRTLRPREAGIIRVLRQCLFTNGTDTFPFLTLSNLYSVFLISSPEFKPQARHYWK